jgi:hypothetical protein
MFKRDQPNKKIIEQLGSRYQLSLKALVIFNSDQLERIKKIF